nr:MAG TPA: hypothetical protein [Caudoviricetes sp.]
MFSVIATNIKYSLSFKLYKQRKKRIKFSFLCFFLCNIIFI